MLYYINYPFPARNKLPPETMGTCKLCVCEELPQVLEIPELKANQLIATLFADVCFGKSRIKSILQLDYGYILHYSTYAFPCNHYTCDKISA